MVHRDQIHPILHGSWDVERNDDNSRLKLKQVRFAQEFASSEDLGSSLRPKAVAALSQLTQLEDAYNTFIVSSTWELKRIILSLSLLDEGDNLGSATIAPILICKRAEERLTLSIPKKGLDVAYMYLQNGESVPEVFSSYEGLGARG